MGIISYDVSKFGDGCKHGFLRGFTEILTIALEEYAQGSLE